MALKVAVVYPESHYGIALWKQFDERGFEVIALADQDFNTGTSPFASANTLPNLVLVHLYDLTAEAMQLLVQTCQAQDIALLCLSSHLVFGEIKSETAWLEYEAATPSDPKGLALLELESIALTHSKAIVLRLPWVVDDSTNPILFNFSSALMAGGKLPVCDHWRGCPVDTQDVVRVVLAMVLQVGCGAENWGVFHLHSSDDCSEAEFADYVRRILVKAGCENLAEIVTVSLDHRFLRSNGWLGGQRCTNDFGIQFRSWRQGVKTKTMRWLSEQVDKGRVELHPEHS